MAVTIKGLSGLTWGVTAETGVNLESISCDFTPAVNEKLNGITGEPIARVASDKLSRSVTASGEITGSTGLMAAATGTAITFANSIDEFGDGTGGLYFDSANTTGNRNGFFAFSLTASSDPLIA